MWKRAILMATLFAGATGLVAHADQKKREEKFCSALTEFKSDFTAMKALGGNATVAQLRTAADKIGDDADKVETAAKKIKTPSAKEFTTAAKQLRKEVRDLPESLTLEQAKARIQDDVGNVKSAATTLANDSGCPEAAPAMAE